MPETMSFTGRRRTRKTKASVRAVDRAARWIIAIGGVGTILAVLAVALFLIWVVMPLFQQADVHAAGERLPGEGPFLGAGIDEYRLLSWRLLPSGSLEVVRVDDGRVREELRPFDGGELRSASFVLGSEEAAFGMAGGRLQLGRVGFETSVRDLDDLPEDVAEALQPVDAPVVDHGRGVAQRTPQGQARIQEFSWVPGKSVVLSGPVEEVALAQNADGLLLAALLGPDLAPALEVEDAEADPAPWRVVLVPTEETSDFMTGRSTREFLDPVEVPVRGDRTEPPIVVRLGGAATELWLVWADGWTQRIDLRNLSDLYVAETGFLVSSGHVTAFDFVLGNTTLVWGTDAGEVFAGFLARPEDLDDPDAPGLDQAFLADRATSRLVRAKVIAPPRGSAVSSFGQSTRSRLLLVGFADGNVHLYNVTNATRLTRTRIAEEPIRRVILAPKEDGLLALVDDGFYSADLDPRYPEASFSALFRPVWYEGYGGPSHIWQSSSATDDFEMKLGLMPLIFGTLKATFYSMLIGAPLALLAAIFTSEFLDPRARSVVKPSIELMASLPSVVLGFLAALVFAPVVEKIVPATLAVFVTMPLVFLVGAYLWQLLPSATAIRFEGRRFLFILAVMPLGFVLAAWLGPVLERLFFAGDIKGWLAWDGGSEGARFASATGGWMMLFLPLSAFAVVFLSTRLLSPWMRGRSADWSRRQYALADAARFLGLVVATALLAWLLSALFSALGFDPRGSFVDTYGQRNALIVGFVMGFAVIPIIYTISEDALSTVPEHLRSASLGAGATKWQTAIRIVLPTAMSGLFSAMMVGLGRAVGETMIVLMAAGNTPVMEWNVFEGFRTLSANIAVELPEAVRNSTHYRTLFLAALTLFAMTFLVNTIAEIIRLRFRKRAYQL